MGSKSSKTAESPAKVTPVYFTPTYEVRRKFVEEHFGEVSLVTDVDTRRDMYLKEITLTTKEAFEAELLLCEKRTDYAHANENVVKMIGYNHKSESKMCSSLYKINIFLEVITKTLADLLKDAEQTNRPFDEIELLYLAENLISCLAYFQTQGISHGDIRPVNVFAAETLYKLADPTLTVQSSALVLALAGEKVFLAPEVLRLLPERDFKATYDKFRADVFAVGATLLSVATLTRSEDLYNYEKGTVNEALINERLDKVRLNFSDFTYNLIKDMLITDVWKRPDFVQLETKIAPFQKAIRQRQALTPTFDLDDDILQRAAIQIARSQELRATLGGTVV